MQKAAFYTFPTTRQMLTASRGEPENACTCIINIIQSIFDIHKHLC